MDKGNSSENIVGSHFFASMYSSLQVASLEVYKVDEHQRTSCALPRQCALIL